MHVSHLEPGALTRQTTRAERRETALVREPGERVRLVHELADSCEEPKNSLIAATTGRMLMSVCGVIASTSWVVMRSRTTRSMRLRADAQLVLDELADRAHPAVAEVVDVVGEVAGVAVVQLHDVADRREDVGLRQREVGAVAAHVDVRLRDRQVEALEAELRVLLRELLRHLVAADLREVVALRVEEEVLEQRARRVGGRRLARTQLAVDVDERLVGARGVVLLERVAHRLVAHGRARR